MTATQASKRVLMRLDDLQASLGDMMTRVNRLEEAVRTMVAVSNTDNLRIESLHKRVEALERSDG